MALGTPYLIGSASQKAATATLVISVGSTAAGSTGPGHSTVAGDPIVVGASIQSTETITNVQDSQGNSYATFVNATAINSTMWVALNTTALVSGTDTITITYSGSTSLAQNAAAVGCSGVATASAVDITVQATGTSATPSVASGTLAQAAELLVSYEADAFAGGAITWGGSWVIQAGSIKDLSNHFSSIATQVVSSTASVTATGSITSALWEILLISLKAATATTWVLTGTAGSTSVTGGQLASSDALGGTAGNTPVTTAALAWHVILAGTSANVSTAAGSLALSGLSLLVSMAAKPGTDAYGNSFPAGFAASAGAIPGSLLNNGSVPATAVSFTARGIGGITTTFASSAPAGAVAGDLWFDTSNGNRLNQFSGSAFVPFTYGTNSISAGAVTAALIAANTITAAQIAAGTITTTQIAAGTITAADLIAGIVVAGIVDATTIMGAKLVADGSSGSILGSSGTAANGNLIASVSPVSGNDSFSNPFPAGITSYALPATGDQYRATLMDQVNAGAQLTFQCLNNPFRAEPNVETQGNGTSGASLLLAS